MPIQLTRRRLLALGGAGFTASLSGCAETMQDEVTDLANSVDGSPKGAAPPEDEPKNTVDPRESPAAFFRTRTRDEYALYRLPAYEGWYTHSDPEWPLVDHPDTRSIRVSVSDAGVGVRVEEMRLEREVAVAVRYQRGDGSVATSDWKRVAPDSDTFRAYEWTIPVDTGVFPTRRKALLQIVLRDHTTRYELEHILAAHHFVAIPYENSTGTDIHYVNADRLNYEYATLGESEWVEPDRLVTDHVDTEEERTRFFVLANHRYNGSGKYYTGYTTVPHDAYREYLENQNHDDYRMKHHPHTYVYNAGDFEYFTSLADSFAASLDVNGVTDRFSRLQQLAYLVGCLRYQADPIQHPQLYTLYEAYGDCADVTMLYLALMNTDAFDHTRGAMVACDLYTSTATGNHAIPVIDERDLGTPPGGRDIYWVEPDDEDLEYGIPDTRYAFLEVTQPRPIGAFDPDDYDIHYFIDTTDLDGAPEFHEF